MMFCQVTILRFSDSQTLSSLSLSASRALTLALALSRSRFRFRFLFCFDPPFVCLVSRVLLDRPVTLGLWPPLEARG